MALIPLSIYFINPIQAHPYQHMAVNSNNNVIKVTINDAGGYYVKHSQSVSRRQAPIKSCVHMLLGGDWWGERPCTDLQNGVILWKR